MSDFRQRVIQEITRPTARDGQSRVGPSEIGNPCDRCLGRGLVDQRPEQEFSLYPWLGTGNHFYMEHETFKDQEHELRLDVGEVRGYGTIKGSTDMYDDVEEAVVDWKFVGAKKIKDYKVNGVPMQYRFQAQLYARGCERQGKPIEKLAIVFIPRDSGNVKEIFVHEEVYNPDMALAALERASQIYEFLLENDMQWNKLEEGDSCFQCNYNW